MPKASADRAKLAKSESVSNNSFAAPPLTINVASVTAMLPSAAWAQGGAWVGTWSASPMPRLTADSVIDLGLIRTFRDQTIRQIVHVSLGGDQVRVEISNVFGKVPLVIGNASVGLPSDDGGLVEGSVKPLLFSGRDHASIPPGAEMFSDPVEFKVANLSDLAIDIYLPNITPLTTMHAYATQTAYISPNGDFTGQTSFEAASTNTARMFLSGVEVFAEGDPWTVVTLGDSITDGVGSTLNSNSRWPDILAARLIKSGANISVLNEGIGGNRVLNDRLGVNALARFDRDVLSHPKVKSVILLEGINDIAWPNTLLVPEGEYAPSADDIIAGCQQLIVKAHSHDIKIIAGTLTPFKNTGSGTFLPDLYTEEKEQIRLAVNEWIRTSGEFDGVIDFEHVVMNPDDPISFLPAYDLGDHIHPNDAGYRAMGEAVDLNLLGFSQ